MDILVIYTTKKTVIRHFIHQNQIRRTISFKTQPQTFGQSTTKI